MGTFKASAATYLSQFTDDLLKDDCTSAIECPLRDNVGYETNAIFFQTLDALLSSFNQLDYRTQGLYRLSGNNGLQRDFLHCFENNPMTIIRQYIRSLSAIDRACALKSIIRKLKETIFPYSQRAALVNVSKNEASNLWIIQNGGNLKSLKALQILCYFIPHPHRVILFKLIPHLKKVICEEEYNKMSLSNIALLFTPLIFPVIENGGLNESERDIESMSKLLMICIHHFKELFSLPDDLILHVDNSLRLQRDDSDFHLNNFLQSDESEPIIATPIVYCSPSKSTTDYEMANLMAKIHSMKDGDAKKKLIKRYQKMQRGKLGIDESKLRKPLLSLNIMSKLSKTVGKTFSVKSKNENESDADETYGSSINLTDEFLETSRQEFRSSPKLSSSTQTVDLDSVGSQITSLKKVPSREYLI